MWPIHADDQMFVLVRTITINLTIPLNNHLRWRLQLLLYHDHDCHGKYIAVYYEIVTATFTHLNINLLQFICELGSDAVIHKIEQFFRSVYFFA